jgi:hypothetical protein
MISARAAIRGIEGINAPLSVKNLAANFALKPPFHLSETLKRAMGPYVVASGPMQTDTVNGWCEVTFSRDGSYRWRGQIHEAGALNHYYYVQTTLGLLPPGQWLIAAHEGRVFGTLTPGSRDDAWDESGQDDRIRVGWLSLRTLHWVASGMSADTGVMESLETIASVLLANAGIQSAVNLSAALLHGLRL